MRNKYLLILIVVVFVALGFVVGRLAAAGSLDPASAPGSTSSYTLAAIYQRLDTGAVPTEQPSFKEPDSGPGGTMYTINDIMGKAPAPDAVNAAAAGNVVTGKTFWGLGSGGGWGLITGTMPSRTVVSTTVSQSAGYYNAFDLSAVDGDLVGGNIKGGVSIFGVTGTYPIAAVSKTTGKSDSTDHGAAWPNPRFTDDGHGTITDNMTGLIWLKNAYCAQATANVITATTYITEINSSGTMNAQACGDTSSGGSHQTDWRLPTLRELTSLHDYGYYKPPLSNRAGTGQAAEGDPFSNTPVEPALATTCPTDYYYWTSTRDAEEVGFVWAVGMGNGLNARLVYTSEHCVWPVRGGQ